MEAEPREHSRAAVSAVPAISAIAAGTALTLVTGLVAAGTLHRGDRAGPVPAARPPDPQAVAAVLDRRARAVRDGDRTAFLATVYTAEPRFQDRQRQQFDNLRRLPLRLWREETTGTPVATGPRGTTLRVTVRYQLSGHDGGPVARTRYLTLAPRTGGWSITGDGTAQGRSDDVEIWDGGPLAVVRGRHSLVIGENAPPARLHEIARRLDAAVPDVTDVLGRGWSRRVVALVPADGSRAAALAGVSPGPAASPGGGLGNIAALAAVAPGADGSTGGDRIVISPGTFGRLNALGRRVVLTHELTHVATGGARDGTTPIWLVEGLADYVGYRNVRIGVRTAAGELRREVRAGRTPARLPGPADFAGDSGRQARAYEEAWLACRMVADRYGEAALLRLYRTAGTRSEAAALHAELGLTPARFTALWRAYLERELS
ncbi:hypothetical protein DPM19_21795 [Actinomadura craniellae]|uniref:Peptidase MA-like domain-containing protein n=1 Tax=Actinomadura craniellae TaxID=2231787 RepID=A0A365H207_9ACTN|nr:hypothetical protein [Actinomadura craniellae]RAY13127.1 hypothetical protein DPM19_21795 [Actinomadura craniellae]